MNKELLISIKPEHLVNILNGKKTLELRKTVPKHYKGWVNIYCTKAKKSFRVMSFVFNDDILYKLPNGQIKFGFPYEDEKKIFLNGKVVARFWFDEYDTYNYEDVSYPEGYEDYDGTFVDTTNYVNGYYVLNTELEKLCLSYDEFETYGDGKTLYAWHIEELEIFDKPKELSDFYKANIPYIGSRDLEHALEYYGHEKMRDVLKYTVKKPPQSYQFVYVKEKENEKV